MLRTVLVAATVASLAAAASAGAASPFGPPRAVVASGTFSDARMNASGDVALAWEGRSGVGPANATVDAVTAVGGSEFSGVQRLASGQVAGPRLALDVDGRVAAIWFDGQDAVGLASGSIQGGFGPATTFRPPGRTALAVGSAGQAVAVWAERSNGSPTYTRVLAAYRPAAGTFGSAVVLGEHGHVDPNPAVVIDRGSTVLVAWRAGAAPSGAHQVWLATIPAGGRPVPATALSAPGEDARTPPRLVLGEAGDVAASWYGVSPELPAGGSRVAVRPADGRFGAPETVAERSRGLRVVLDADGAALAVWSDTLPRRVGRTKVLGVRRRPAGGPFGPLHTIRVPRLVPNSHRGGLDGRGNAVVAWAEDRAGSRVRDPVLLAAVQRPDQTIGLPTTLGRRSTPEALVFDSGVGGYLVARGPRTAALRTFAYNALLLDVPSSPLSGVTVNARRRRARFVVGEPGSVVVRVDRVAARRCRGCVRHRRVSRRTVGVRRGRRAVSLTGPRGRPLGPGTYRLSLAAHDLTGRRLALRRVGFRIVAG